VVAVETALVLPVLLLLTLGMIEFGWYFLKSESVVSAARSGARVAIRADSTTQDVVTTISSIMASTGLGDSGYATTITPADVSTATSGQHITVKIEVPYGNIALMGDIVVPASINIRSVAVMAKEGP
jgi:Flp pilus assembly protein TadG